MKRLWIPQEMTATRRCQNRSNDLIHGGGVGGGVGGGDDDDDDDDDCKHV